MDLEYQNRLIGVIMILCPPFIVIWGFFENKASLNLYDCIKNIGFDLVHFYSLLLTYTNAFEKFGYY